MKPADHILAVVKAGVSAVPYVGGLLASLIGDYIPMSTQRNIEHTAELLRGKITSLEARLDVEAVDKDEFAELFKSCYLVIVRTHHEQKLRAATALIANLLLKSGDPDKVSYNELDHFVRCLDALSIGAINVLGAAYNLRLGAQGDNEGNLNLEFGRIRNRLGTVDPHLLMGLIAELNTFNLMRFGRPLAISLPNFESHPVQLTPLGIRFVERFIDGRM